MSALIEVQGLVNRFGDHWVHDGIDLSVTTGEIFGLVGGSGSGKSVLLNSIIGLHRPSAGRVRLLGRDMLAASSREKLRLLRRCGVVFQGSALFSSLTVAENVVLPIVEMQRLPPSRLRELAAMRLQLVGLPLTALDQFPSELSGGMKRRAALARALAMDPELLFLDEPTSGLDPVAAEAFDHLILQLRSSLNLTVVMITHDLDTLASVCDRVGVLVDKHLTVGTLAQVRASEHPWIREYFHSQRADAAFAAQSPGE